MNIYILGKIFGVVGIFFAVSMLILTLALSGMSNTPAPLFFPPWLGIMTFSGILNSLLYIIACSLVIKGLSLARDNSMKAHFLLILGSLILFLSHPLAFLINIVILSCSSIAALRILRTRG